MKFGDLKLFLPGIIAGISWPFVIYCSPWWLDVFRHCGRATGFANSDLLRNEIPVESKNPWIWIDELDVARQLKQTEGGAKCKTLNNICKKLLKDVWNIVCIWLKVIWDFTSKLNESCTWSWPIKILLFYFYYSFLYIYRVSVLCVSKLWVHCVKTIGDKPIPFLDIDPSFIAILYVPICFLVLSTIIHNRSPNVK